MLFYLHLRAVFFFKFEIKNMFKNLKVVAAKLTQFCKTQKKNKKLLGYMVSLVFVGIFILEKVKQKKSLKKLNQTKQLNILTFNGFFHLLL